MPRLRRLIPVVSFAWAFGLIACGTQQETALNTNNAGRIMYALGEPDDQGQAQAEQEQQEQQEQQAQQSSETQKLMGDPNSATCDAIHAQLVTYRASLQATPEWQALEQTKEYAAVDAAASEMHVACDDGHDSTKPPSAACIAAYAKFKADLVAMKTTSEWEAVKGTTAYATLKDTYGQYHDAGCGHS